MRIEHYTEVFLDDAMRLCKYIAGDDGVITVNMADPVNFPDPPKGLEFPTPLYAARVSKGGITVAECAYLTRRESDDEAKRFRNRWLLSLMLGDEIRRARENAGMTIEELSEITGYSTHSIDAMERGRYNIDAKILGRLADAMECEIRLVKSK